MAISQNFPTVRPTLNLNFARSKILDPRITFERNSIGTYVDEDGLIRTAGVDEARFDHDPATGESLGLLIEETRTNKALRSENFAHNTSYWRTQDGSVTSLSSVTSPDGVSNMWLIDLSHKAGTATHGSRVYQSGLSFNNAVNTFSFYARSVSGTGTFPVAYYNGTDYIKSYIELTETTRRYEISCPALATSGSNIFAFTRRGTTHNETLTQAYVWGAQVEEGSFPTSYIPTSNSTVTRSSDQAKITGTNFTDFYNQSEGSFVSDIKLNSSFPVSGYASISFTLSDNSYNNRVTLASSTGSAAFNADVTVSGTNTRAVLGNYTSGASSIRTSMGYKASDTAGCLNGATVVTSSPGTVPLLTRADIGKDHLNNNLLNGHIRQITYYPKRLTNAQLQSLTK